jgi:hypothetical protein
MAIAAVREDFLFSLRHPRLRSTLLLLMTTLFLLVGTGVFYWWPARNSAEHVRTQIEDKRQEIFRLESSARLAQASGRAAQQVAQIENKLDASVTQASLVKNLAALARKHNVKIISEAYEEGKSEDGYTPLVHTLTLQAGYPQIRGLLSGLQSLPSFTILQEATIGQSPGGAAVRAQLSLITYRRTAGIQQ